MPGGSREDRDDESQHPYNQQADKQDPPLTVDSLAGGVALFPTLTQFLHRPAIALGRRGLATTLTWAGRLRHYSLLPNMLRSICFAPSHTGCQIIQRRTGNCKLGFPLLLVQR